MKKQNGSFSQGPLQSKVGVKAVYRPSAVLSTALALVWSLGSISTALGQQSGTASVSIATLDATCTSIRNAAPLQRSTQVVFKDGLANWRLSRISPNNGEQIDEKWLFDIRRSDGIKITADGSGGSRPHIIKLAGKAAPTDTKVQLTGSVLNEDNETVRTCTAVLKFLDGNLAAASGRSGSNQVASSGNNSPKPNQGSVAAANKDSSAETSKAKEEAQTASEAEVAKAKAETARLQAENARVVAENARAKEEAQKLAAAEAAKAKAETSRLQAENTRILAETAKAKEEAQKAADAEAARARVETARLQAENTRIAAENAKAKDEAQRLAAAEAAKAKLDTSRLQAENSKAREEAQRIAEAAKAKEEAQRVNLAQTAAKPAQQASLANFSLITPAFAQEDAVAIRRSQISVYSRQIVSLNEVISQYQKDYSARRLRGVNEVQTKITLLSQCTSCKNRTQEIEALRVQVRSVQSVTILRDPLYMRLKDQVNLLQSQLKSEIASVKSSIVEYQKQNQRQLAEALVEVERKFSEFDRELQTTESRILSVVDENKADADRKFAEVETSLATLTSQIANLDERQTATQKQLDQTDNRLTATRSVLANILLPISERGDDWMLRVAAVPVQQQQFCRIVDRFHDELAQVYKVRNEIKKNILFKDRQQDLASLLPGGGFNSWVVRVVEVTQAIDGSAAVLLQPPCRAMLGSDACSNQPGKIRATIAPNSLIYRELGRLNSGDFVTISGTIIYAKEAVDDRPVPQYALYEPSKHCSVAEGSKDQDVFVTSITNLVQLR